MNVRIEKIEADFSICMVENFSKMDLSRKYLFFAKTNEENSLVCLTRNVSQNIIIQDKG